MDSTTNAEKSASPFIRVPKTLLKRTDISQTAKLLYGLILCLSDTTGHCYASDSYLADEMGMSVRQVHRAVSELESLRIVLVTGATNRRHIHPTYAKNVVSEGVTGSELKTEMAQVDPQLTTQLSKTYAKNVHIINKNKKENIKEILPAAFQEKKEPDADPNKPRTPKEAQAWILKQKGLKP